MCKYAILSWNTQLHTKNFLSIDWCKLAMVLQHSDYKLYAISNFICVWIPADQPFKNILFYPLTELLVSFLAVRISFKHVSVIFCNFPLCVFCDSHVSPSSTMHQLPCKQQAVPVWHMEEKGGVSAVAHLHLKWQTPTPLQAALGCCLMLLTGWEKCCGMCVLINSRRGFIKSCQKTFWLEPFWSFHPREL